MTRPDSTGSNRPDALVFDLYGTLVDPIAISSELARTLPVDMALQVARLWRQKQIEYSFRLTLMDLYENFEWVTERSLEFALLACGQVLSTDARTAVLERYDAPDAFPDVVPGLELLQDAGHELYVLSNGSAGMVQRCLMNSGLAEYFSAWLSVDEVAAFKPAVQVYELASRSIGRPLQQLRLISCNPFDIVGGQVAGMSTVWVNRSGGPFDTIGNAPDMTVSTIEDLGVLLSRKATGSKGDRGTMSTA